MANGEAEELSRVLIEAMPGGVVHVRADGSIATANAEALRVYDRLRVLLRDELGIAPSPEVQSVYRRLLGETAPKTTA